MNLLAKIYEAYGFISIKSFFLINKLFNKNCKKIPQKIERILIINPQMIGDTLIMTPVFKVLKNKFPKTEIDLVLNPISLPILENNPYINNIFLYYTSLQEYFSLIKKLRRNNYDVLIDLQNTFSGIKRSLFPLFCKIPYRISTRRGNGFTGFLPSTEVRLPDKHIAQEYLSALTPLGITSTDTTLSINLSEEQKRWVNQFLKDNNIGEKDKLIGLHVSSKNRLHRWTSSGFSEVAKYYLEKNYRIILTGVENESEQVIEILKNTPQIIYAKNISLKEFSALIARYNLLISIDTASVHIATATNTPTVVLIGPTLLKYWAPLNKRNQRVIEHILPCKERCISSSVNKILPMEKCIYKENYCLTGIPSKEVIKVADGLLEDKYQSFK